MWKQNKEGEIGLMYSAQPWYAKLKFGKIFLKSVKFQKIKLNTHII